MTEKKKRQLEVLIKKLNEAMIGVETNVFSEMPTKVQNLIIEIDKAKNK